MSKKINLTPKQRRIMDDLMQAGGQIQIHNVSYVHRSLRALFHKGLIRYSTSGAWISISAPGHEPDEPGEHILRSDVSIILRVLKNAGGTVSSSWELLDLCRAEEKDFNIYHMESAIRYGGRKGLLCHGGGYDRLSNCYRVTILPS